MNKKGVSLAETLAVIIMTGIVITLLANVIQFFAISISTINAEERLSTDGMFLERKLYQDITNFGPNNASLCLVGGVEDDQCVDLTLDYHFEWDPINEMMVVYDDTTDAHMDTEISNISFLYDTVPKALMRLEISNGQFLVDGEPVNMFGNIVLDTSTFAVYKNTTTDSLTLIIHLEIEGDYKVTEEFIITKIIEQT